MAQNVIIAADLGAGNTGLTIGYRVLNVDRTEHTAFTTTGVSESGDIAGYYYKNALVSIPDQGAYIVWGESGTDYVESVEPAKPVTESEINAQVDTALTDYDAPTKTEMDSAFTEIKGSTWSSSTDTLEDIRDKQTDIESKIDTVDSNVDAVLLDTGTSGVVVATNNDKSGYSLSSAGIQAIWDALTSALTTANSIGKLLVDNIDATISSRSTVTTAQVNTEVDTALNDYDAPTKTELDAAFTEIKGATWNNSTDTLEAIRDKETDIETKVDTIDTNLDNVASTIFSNVLESGKTFSTFIIDMWSVIAGNALANDSSSPTNITYDSPDDSVQVTHTLTDTTRTVS